jgi:hypothetical protein
MNLQYLVFVGASAQLFGIVVYIKDIFRGKTNPNLATWTLWFIAPMIATAAALSKGVRWSVLPVFLAGFGPLLVVIGYLISRKPYWKLNKLDYICIAFSLCALFLWYVTREANYAVAFSILADAFAGLPTIIKSWRFPETESTLTYELGIFSLVLSLFAIKHWVFAAYSLPIYFILMNSSLTVAAMLGRKRISKQSLL